MSMRAKLGVKQNKKVIFALAGVVALTVAVGVRYSADRHVATLPQSDAVTEAASPTKVEAPQGTGKAKGRHRPAKKTQPKSADLLGPKVELIETQPVETRYDCDGDCPAGYDITNTTGSKTEARWLHAAGFPTVAEYKSLTENDAALAEAMRRSDAGDARAAAILGQYFLEQKDYVESSRQLGRAKLQCNIFAYRVNAQLYLNQAPISFTMAAEELRVAYLMGDQEAALELASLLEASNLTDRARLGMIDQRALAMFGGTLQVNREHHYGGCRYHGIRPRPGMRNLE